MGFDEGSEGASEGASERQSERRLRPEELPPRWLRCAACRAEVVRSDARIERGGRHQHTRTNPAGVTFTIGCFSVAPGVAVHGSPEPRWTWFPTHAWSMALCGSCGTHLGWRYVAIADGGDPFEGLILDRLVEDD